MDILGKKVSMDIMHKKDIDPCYYTGYCERLENKKSGRTC